MKQMEMMGVNFLPKHNQESVSIYFISGANGKFFI